MKGEQCGKLEAQLHGSVEKATMSKASLSQIQQLPVSRPFQPSQLAAVRNPACIRWPLRNQTAGMLSGSTGILRPSCSTQPSGNGFGICIRCDGDRRRTIAQP